MAIQLNDRDHLIFKMIDEHQVLLEKHISWFIAGEDKPVLIRDRLRKLFYLDYLLCQRHGTKLPWWTTPTKPLVYMLAPMSKPMSKNVAEKGDRELDLFDNAVQRHLLEVANIRMLCLIAKKDGDIEDFNWLTLRPSLTEDSNLDAIASVKARNQQVKIGIINHPADNATFLTDSQRAIAENDVQALLVVSRDETHQQRLQKLISTAPGKVAEKRIYFVTHHEFYRSGIAKACMQAADGQTVNLFGESPPPAQNPMVSPTAFSNPSILAI